MTEFGESLKQWRKAHKLTQKEAASRLNANLHTFQNWEYGLSKPAKICRNCIKAEMEKGVLKP